MTRGKPVIPNDRQSENLFTEQQQISDSEGSNLVVRTQAAFISKLYKMLEDTSIHHLISWSEKGDLFSVSNPTTFSKIVLPQYFKHNNWQSFVRQLNMYGFHKVNDMIHLNLTSDTQTWEFKHPHFKRGEIEDLQNIKRKSTKPQLPPPARSSSSQLTLENNNNNQNEDSELVQKHILHLEERLLHVSRSYDLLQNETIALKAVQLKQQELINDLTMLLTNILEENADTSSLSNSEKNTILSKLSNVQSLLFQEPSVGREEFQTDIVMISPPNCSTRSSYSSNDSVQPYASSSSNMFPPPLPPSNNNTINQRMGLGKESHLLNPAPLNNSSSSAMNRNGEDAYEYKRKRL